MKRALTAFEDTNRYGGAHVTNIEVARKALNEGRDLIVLGKHYDGQMYHYYKFRVTDLHETEDGRIIGLKDDGDFWQATAELCEIAKRVLQLKRN